ncbi:MAG: SHOCT domain-containing protein [Microthrixaceae bacterium]|nr:SHOCT domain-containing protein [Microthrixaceae bacterium]MCO5307111.1 SHOCT domain-containing protein [Microthrixaceae bacterium]
MHYWNNGGSTPWGMWVAMAVMMTIFVLAAAWVIVTMVRHSAAPQTLHQSLPSGTQQTSAAAILDERFARGEIDADEYTQRKTTLHSPTGTV